MKQLIRILLTGVGSPAASGVIKSLRLSDDFEFHIVGIDCNDQAVGFHMCDNYYVGPKSTDSLFIPFLLELCNKEKIDMVISLVTSELVKLAEAKEELLSTGTRILISEADLLKKVVNKGELYKRLESLGISVPDFHVVHTTEGFRTALHKLGFPEKEVCFKPAFSDGSRGFHIMSRQLDEFHQIFFEKPNSTYVSEQELFRIIGKTDEIPETIVMEYLPYEEYSVDLLMNMGKVVVAVPRMRIATVGGISTKSIICKHQDIIDYAVQVTEMLKLHGNIGIQIRRDERRVPKIVEINPRIQGTIVHCTAAGINLPLLAVKQAFGIAPSPSETLIKWETKMTRYWEEVFYNADGSSYAL